MRQAGRCVPEYKAAPPGGGLRVLCRNAELACEVTLQPLRRYPLMPPSSSPTSSPCPDAMGLGLYFEQGEGPRFELPTHLHGRRAGAAGAGIRKTNSAT
ncbi:uroporphyrinogen decarboxylase family protein [Shigella flexneri]